MNVSLQSNRVSVVTLSLWLCVNSIGFGADAPKAADKPLIKTTHVYKSVGDVKVEVDVSRPVVVWIHEAGFGRAAKVSWGTGKYLLNRRLNHDAHNSRWDAHYSRWDSAIRWHDRARDANRNCVSVV